MEIRIINTVDAFQAIRDEWDMLVLSSDPDNIYVCSMWIESQLEELRQGDEIFIFCAWEGGEFLGALPMIRENEKAFPLVRYRNIACVYTGHFDLPVKNRAYPLLESLWKEFAQFIGNGYEVQLLNIRKDALAFQLYEALGRIRGRLFFEKVFIGSDYICNMTKSFAEYTSSLKRNDRKSINKITNRVYRDPTTVVLDAASLEGVDAFIKKAAMVEARSWKGRVNSVRTRDYESLITNICEKAVDRHTFHLFALLINGHMVAFQICPVISGYMVAMVTGYDEKYKYFAPGKCLINHAIKTAHAKSYKCMDLYHHSDSYKKRITASFSVEKYLLRMYGGSWAFLALKGRSFFRGKAVMLRERFRAGRTAA